MKLNNLIVISSLFILVFASCKKETSLDTGANGGGGTGNTTASRPKTYTEDVTDANGHLAVTFNLTYDASKRVTGLVSQTDPGTKFVYSYSSSSLFKMDIFDAGTLSIHEEFYLNSNGQPDSTFQYNDTGDSTTEKYIYNPAKQLTLLKNYIYTKAAGSVFDFATAYQYDSNGNVSKETDGFTVTTFDYTSIANPLINLSPFTFTYPKLVKTTTISSGGVTTVLNHTYTFDSTNRLTSEKIADNGNTIVVIKSYTY